MTHYPLDGLSDSTSLADFAGCVISVNAGDNTKVDISSGLIKIVDNSNLSLPIIRTVVFLGETALTLTGTEGATFLYIDNTGSILQKNEIQIGLFLRSNVGIGIPVHSPGGTVNAVSNFTPVSPQSAGLAFADLSAALGAINNFTDKGNKITANGANLSLDKSSGSWYYASINSRIDVNNPNLIGSPALIATNQFFAWRITDGSGTDTDFTNVITAGVYDDGTAIDADNAPVGILRDFEWTNHWLFHLTDSNLLALQYGRAVFNNPIDALHNIMEEFQVLTVLNSTTPIATITMRGGATRLDLETDAIITQATETGDFRL